MKIEDVRIFVGMDSDSEDRLVPSGDYRDAVHFRVGRKGAGENLLGNRDATVLSVNTGFALPSGTNRRIGSIKNEDTIIYFVYNSAGNHSIIELNVLTYKLTYILKSESILNFQLNKAYLIHLGRTFVLDGYLYWTDNYNAPRCINLSRAKNYTMEKDNAVSFSAIVDNGGYMGFVVTDSKSLAVGDTVVTTSSNYWDQNGDAQVASITSYLVNWKLITTNRPYVGGDAVSGYIYKYWGTGYYYGLTEQVLDQCAYPPIYPPECEYADDDQYATTRDVNLLNGKLFQFRYQYVYTDNRKSVWSAISKACIPTELQRINGYPVRDQWKENHIDVTYRTGSVEVKQVNVAFREGNTGKWRLWTRIDKYDEDTSVLGRIVKISSNTEQTISFYNNIIGEGLEQNDVNRLYDSVPFKASAQALVNKNRTVWGDYQIGQDNVKTDVSLTAEYSPLSLPTAINGVRDIVQNQLIVVYLESTIWNTYPNALWQLRIPLWDVTSDVFAGIWSFYYLSSPDDTISSIRDNLERTIDRTLEGRIWLVFPNGGGYFDNDITMNITNEDRPPLAGQDVYQILNTQEYPIVINVYDATRIHKSFKYNATHPFVMIYGDDSGRIGAANDIGSVSTQAPFVNNDYVLYDPDNPLAYNSFKEVKIKWQLNHDPPTWATNYRFGYAPPQGTFIYGMACDFSVDEDKVRFSLNSFFGDFNEANERSIIPNYIWQKGDRIRFIAVKPGNFAETGYNNPYNAIYLLQNKYNGVITQEDFEIQGEYYHETTSYDPYQKYTVDAEYVKDEHGNRIYKPSAQQVYVVGLDLNKYNIWQGRFDVTDEANPIDLGSDEVLVEIYRPNKEVTEEGGTYFEVGDVYEITNGQHSVTSGYFDCGDVYIKLRTWLQEGFMFPVEDKNLSDYYESNYHDMGRINTVLPDMKRQTYFNQIMHSGTYLPNTNVNNLGKVDAWDYAQMPVQSGNITFMGQQGFTLIVMQEYGVNSVYIGKVVLRESKTTGGVVATTENIFGEINPSETTFGCKHPESVVDVNRNFYFYDVTNAKYILYAANGMHPVSDYKFNKYFRELTELVLADSNAIVLSGWDRKNEEVLVSVVTLPNYTLIRSAVFFEPRNRWTYTNGWACEGLDCQNNVFVAFKDGKPWIFDNPIRNNFFGTQYDSQVYVIGNKEPLMVKTWESAVLDTNKNWSAAIDIPASETYGRGMVSRIKSFINSEGRMWASFLRNMVTHQSTPTVADLINGSYLKGNVIRVRLTNTDTDEAVLFSATLNGLESK